jgi:hypothetical protein
MSQGPDGHGRLVFNKTQTIPMSGLSQSRQFDRAPPTFAVGTRVTSRPPHRSVRAQFGHTAPTSGV